MRAAVPGGVDLLLDAAGGQTRDQALGAVRDGVSSPGKSDPPLPSPPGQQHNTPHRPEEMQYATRGFMRGVRTLQSTVQIPASARTASNAAVKFDPRSRIMNLTR